MTLRTALMLGLCCAFIDLFGARLLDSFGFVEGLLAPSGAQLLWLVPAAFAFYGARLITYFVLPALVVARLLSVREPCDAGKHGTFGYRNGTRPGADVSAGDDRLRVE
jgi:hypothetical protein